MFGVPPLGVPTGMYGQGLRALAEAGCDVALDGHDGDGTLGNVYAWSANTLLDGRLDRLAGAAREVGPRFILRELVKDFVSPSVWSRLRRRPGRRLYRASFLPYFRGETARAWPRRAAGSGREPAGSSAQLQALLPPTTQTFEEFELLGARSRDRCPASLSPTATSSTS